MEAPKVNPPGTTSGNPGQPTGGPVVGLAAKVAAQHGSGPVSAAPKVVPGKVGPGSKGGRRTFAEDLAKYLSETGQTLSPAQTNGAQNVVAMAPPAYVVTPEFIGDVCETLLKGVEAHRVRSTALRVKTLTGDMPLAKEYAESAAAPPGCIATISKGMIEVAKKYPMMLQWAPEVTVASGFAMWVKKDLDGQSRLDELEKRIVAARNVTPPKEAPPAAGVPTN